LGITGKDFVSYALKDGIEAGERRGCAVDVVFNIPIDDSQDAGRDVTANAQ
jgi:hypothetical protein